MSSQNELIELIEHEYYKYYCIRSLHNDDPYRLNDVFLVRDVNECSKRREGNCREQAMGDLCQTDSACIEHFRVVKRPRTQSAENENETRECECLERIYYDQIPKLYHYFKKDNRIHIVQEYISGKSYKQKILENPIGVDIYHFLKHFLDILIYLQDNKLIHRDIKPSNIMCREQDNLPVLIDFGCVFNIDNTITYSEVGSRNYRPHEALYSSNDHNYSSDIFSLGRTVVYLLTAKEPTDEVVKNWTDRTKKVGYTNITEQFKRIINKAMQTEAKDRYQSAREMLIDLCFADGEKLIVNINTWSNIIKTISKNTNEKSLVDLQYRFNEQIYKLILDEEKNINLAQPKKYDKDINKVVREHIIGYKINIDRDEIDKELYKVLKKLAEMKSEVKAQGNSLEKSQIVQKLFSMLPRLDSNEGSVVPPVSPSDIDHQCSPNFYIVYDFFEEPQPLPVPASDPTSPQLKAPRQLKGHEIGKLRDAICDAYRTKEDLAEVLLSKLEFNYDTEVTSKGNYKQQVFYMINNKFEPKHRTKYLLEKLLEEIPTNEKLKDCKKFWKS